MVLVTVIGMSDKELEKIFREFVQLEDTHTKKYKGAGLGLAISKKMIEIMGGKIWVESEINKGSKFYYTVPFERW